MSVSLFGSTGLKTKIPRVVGSMGGFRMLLRSTGFSGPLSHSFSPQCVTRSFQDDALIRPLDAPLDGEANVTGAGNLSTGIYFDVQATTPMDPRVLDEMMPFLTVQYGNAHSTTHEFGWNASAAVEKARGQIATLIGAQAKEIVFTSGATESNNMAVKGIPDFYQKSRRHVVTLQTEHKCVLESCRWLERHGYDVTYLPVKRNGLVDLNQLSKAIRPVPASGSGGTALVSIMAVNNETGVIQPLDEIGKLCRDKGVIFHTDAAQAVGKIPLDVDTMHIDVMSLSSHKIYGPKGCGALFVRRRGGPRVRLTPLLSGGGQERGLRSGTLPVPLVVGFGAACDIARTEMARDHDHLTRLSEKLVKGVMSQLSDVTLNGDPVHKIPGAVNLSFAFVEGESLMMGMPKIAVSSGSACTSASLEPSYVLRGMGVREDLAHTSIRFGLGRFTTEEEVDYLIDQVVRNVTRLRELSPLWEMKQEGIDLDKIQWAGEGGSH